jgi:hypothetical protein
MEQRMAWSYESVIEAIPSLSNDKFSLFEPLLCIVHQLFQQ